MSGKEDEYDYLFKGNTVPFLLKLSLPAEKLVTRNYFDLY